MKHYYINEDGKVVILPDNKNDTDHILVQLNALRDENFKIQKKTNDVQFRMLCILCAANVVALVVTVINLLK